jgi:hypothetical protein
MKREWLCRINFYGASLKTQEGELDKVRPIKNR